MKPEPGNNPFSSAKALLVSPHAGEKQTAYMGSVHIPVVLQELPDAKRDRSDERAAAGCSQNVRSVRLRVDKKQKPLLYRQDNVSC